MGFWHVVFGIYGGSAPEVADTPVTERFDLIGPPLQRFTVNGPTLKRHDITGPHES